MGSNFSLYDEYEANEVVAEPPPSTPLDDSYELPTSCSPPTPLAPRKKKKAATKRLREEEDTPTPPLAPKQLKMRDPVDRIYQNWYYRARVHYPLLKGKEVVRVVYDRWNGKSTLSPQVEATCIRAYQATEGAPVEQKNLILLTAEEARLFDKGELVIPDEIKNQI